jgi:hypothetical protein
MNEVLAQAMAHLILPCIGILERRGSLSGTSCLGKTLHHEAAPWIDCCLFGPPGPSFHSPSATFAALRTG